MRSFLASRSWADADVIGAFYLTEKEGAEGFSDTDQEVIELLAAHAAIAITNARLYEHSRELSVLSERNRLAIELHDVVSQKLFSLVLGAESADTLLERDPGAARAQLERLQSLSREALQELRALVLELRPPDLDRDGLCGTLTKHVELVARLHGARVELDADAGRPPARRATRRSCASPRRRCTTRCATRPRGRCAWPCTRRAPRSCSRSPTTASGSTPATPGCARATWA